MRPILVLGCLGPVVTAAASADPSLFFSVGGRLQATAERPGIFSSSVFVPVVQPGPGSNTAAVGEFIRSATGYDFDESSPQRSTLNITFAHTCAYTLGDSRAYLYSNATFGVTSPTPYSISGLISAPLGLPSVHIEMSFSILPLGGGPALFRHDTSRILSGGSSIILGAALPGDVLTGSAAGTLSSGTTYIIATTIGTINPSGSQATYSSGAFAIALGDPPCAANCDGSPGVPLLTPNDFLCFLNAYASGLSEANCDGSSAQPVLTPTDFQCFVNTYAAGC